MGMRQRAKQPRLRVIAPYSFCSPQVEQMSHPKRPRDPEGALWRLRHNTATFSQQGRAVAANSTFRWSHFAYAISWRTSSSVCASLIPDRHRQGLAVVIHLAFRCAVDARRLQEHYRIGVADGGQQQAVSAFGRRWNDHAQPWNMGQHGLRALGVMLGSANATPMRGA